MRLIRLEVWNWRGLDHVELAELAPDLNLVVGPNESGKSRLFEALRFGLFERHRGESEDKRRLKTWGGSEAPTVLVEFEAGGRQWSLTKRFLRAPSAKLTGPGTTLSDDDAEEKVRSLWGTQEIKGRADTDRFLGLWPLLWVQQGRAGIAPHVDLNADTRTRLSEALAREVHEVAAGRVGQKVLERADLERARYWTVLWKEREELSAARARHASAKDALERKSQRRREAHEAADELARTLERIAKVEPKLLAQREELARAETKVALADDRGRALATWELEAKSRRADRELLQQKSRERAQLEADMAQLAGEIATHDGDLAALDAAMEELEADRAQTRARGEKAVLALSAAKRAAVRTEAEERRALRAAEILVAEKSLRQAEMHHERRRAIDEEVRGLPTATQMKALRLAREAWARAHASLDAAAARVTLRALVPIVVDGRPLAAGQDRKYRLDEPTAISLEGIAELHVSPASAELDRLRDSERDAKEILDARLGQAGAEGIADAEDRHRKRIELEAERGHATAAIEALGASDLTELRDAVETLRRELATSSPAGVEGAAEERAPLGARAAAEALAKAESEVMESRAARDIAEREATRRAADRQVKGTLLSDARARLAAASTRSSVMGPHAALAAALEESERSWTKAEELAQSVREQLRRSGDLDATTDRDRERAALSQLEAGQRALLDRRIALEASLRHFGAEAIHEEVLEAEAELDFAARELSEIERRAEAARALVLALTSARHEIQERLVAPVRRKVEPYLESLLPGARLDVGEDWTVAGLQVDGRAESFDALSGGAKEQVGLLVRLGLAEVLGQDEPLPIVLDDCLVNTDPERQRDMIRILYRAARRQQILLFSCHDVAFERLGATRRYELAPRRAR